MKPLREIFAVNLIALACDGDAANYSPLAKAFQRLPVSFFRRLAKDVDEPSRW